MGRDENLRREVLWVPWTLGCQLSMLPTRSQKLEMPLEPEASGAHESKVWWVRSEGQSLERCLLLLPFVSVRSSAGFSPSSLCFLMGRMKFFHLQKGLNQTVHWKALAHNKPSTIASYYYDCFVIFWEGNRIKDAIIGVSRNLWIMASNLFFLSSRFFFRWGFTWNLNI